MPHFLQRIFIDLGNSLCDMSSKLLQSDRWRWGGAQTPNLSHNPIEKNLEHMILFHHNREYKMTIPQVMPFSILCNCSTICHVNVISVVENTTLTFMLSFDNIFCHRNYVVNFK
jgi:hypothetical protein